MKKKKKTLKYMVDTIKSHYEINSTVAARKHHLEVEFRLVEELGGEMNRILGLASADADKVDMGIIKRLRDYQETLEIYQEPGVAGQVWRILFNEDGDSRNPMSELFNAKETADLKTLYGPKIREAAADALAVLKKYLPRAIVRLKHRLLYNPAREPLDIPRMEEDDDDFDAPSFLAACPIKMQCLSSFNSAGFVRLG